MSWLCRYLQVSRSGFYAWTRRGESARTRANRALVSVMREVHRDTNRAYGSPRMHRELIARGQACGRHRVARLMRIHGLVAQRRRRYRANAAMAGMYARIDNRLLRHDPARRTNELWAGDYTYLRTPQGWLYLAVVLDLYSRRVIGWAVSRQRTANLTREALRMAIDQRKPTPGTLFHSDQGIEYAAYSFQSLLTEHKLEPSMSRRGNCYDNAHLESFFSNPKLEMGQDFTSVTDAVRQIRDYLYFYNNHRRHSRLNFHSPIEYETFNS